MDNYINLLKKDFKEYEIHQSESNYKSKKYYHYVLYKNGIKCHHFELDKKVSIEELEKIFVESYLKEGEE